MGGSRGLHRRRTSTGDGNGAAAGGSMRWRKRLGHGRRVGVGVKRRGRCEVLWGCLNRLGGAPGGGSPAAWPLTAAGLDVELRGRGIKGGNCRMDLLGPTTSVGTRTDYSVGPWDYPACATRRLKAWSTRTTQE
jgi:hypothetical protein